MSEKPNPNPKNRLLKEFGSRRSPSLHGDPKVRRVKTIEQLDAQVEEQFGNGVSGYKMETEDAEAELAEIRRAREAGERIGPINPFLPNFDPQSGKKTS